ncbi:16S rRNA (cytosine(1407)-C(5))-methyltransferase RsmF [Ferrimonas lipolytica]|uniref:Ribosomal RNA small subunit methyltransferase F n=1 Tax=Ferrimonas lipolytica TaxID=2724191 RepID=A0A6H1UD49_9GAMM|nr:16S rRNA (cytosine(1407)-C(5))-methyltransferase RsmF [Ferrimonas lipolytica]QIZ76549.1 16S rRNA (cytosine(1407)-C(5))-methyltransferase RsmF [Ferrimonas lipolytica]
MVDFPQAFLDLIESTMPAHLTLDEFVRYSQLPLRRSIRVNTLKISVEDFNQRMTKKGWRLTPVPWCQQGFWLDGEQDDIALGNIPEHLAGLFYIQEASSMMPPFALFHFLNQPEYVLDVASAPGSKTSQIAALMDNSGLLIANEYSSSRVKVLHSNLQRLGVRNVALTHFDGHVFGPTLPEQFDAILLDAPCGGEGTVRKDPDAMRNWSLQSIDEITQVQRGLIDSAFCALKSGGVMVYSTCTLNRQENHDVCNYLKAQYPDQVEFLSLADLFPGAEQSCGAEGFLHIWPQIYDSEGFFVAAIRKTGSVDSTYIKPRLGNFPFKPADAEVTAQITNYLEQQLGITVPADGVVMARDAELWWFPQNLMPLLDKIRLQRLGVKLADVHKKGFRTHHQAVLALPCDQTRCVELTLEQAEQYLMGRDIPMGEAGGKGETIVCLDGTVLGLAKWINSRLKNGLPRDLVKDKISHYA